MNINAIVLSAGKGTRMKSKLPKVIHRVLDKPMVMHVIDNLSIADVNNIISVVGFEKDKVKAIIKDRTSYVEQLEQLGTGHAIKLCYDLLHDKDGQTIIICGDTPLISSNTISNLIEVHNKNNNSATILTGILDDALSYGRIIRNKDNNIIKIVEYKDANDKERLVKEFNTGTYIFDNKLLFKYINDINNDNAQKEYYLTDIIEILANNNHKVGSLVLDNLDESLGINDRIALEKANKILQKRINEYHMANGITIIDSNTTYIGSDVSIGSETIIKPNTTIYNSSIGNNCEIGPNSEIVNSTILNNNNITNAHIYDSKINNNVNIGPYVRLRQDCLIDDDVRIGNFVEMKNTKFNKASKSAHLAYVGDAVVGKDVNIGCGVITVNFDGQIKAMTNIGDHVFVGCNSNLIAPVNISDNTYIGAGTTITKDVPEYSLAIGRVRQEIKENYINKKENNNDK